MRLIMELGSRRYLATTSAERIRTSTGSRKVVGDGSVDGVAAAGWFDTLGQHD